MSPSFNPLTDIIHQEISEQAGSLSFARFMQLAVYHPEWGYYNQQQLTIGKEGDFITAPTLTPLFAQCLAKQIQQLQMVLPTYSLLELGAGTGQLACDLLLALERCHALPEQYIIVEISDNLKAKQRQLLQKQCAFFIDKIKWLTELPPRFEGIVIANEFLDALPIHCFQQTLDGIKERCVGLENRQLVWHLKDNLLLEEYTQNHPLLPHLPLKYCSEINLQLPTFIKTLAATLQKGMIFFIDYGYGEKEYYDPRRNQGTLTCFYQHQKNNNPFLHIGKQDITAHVNFTQLASAAIHSHLSLAGFTTQQQFLLACGLLKLAETSATTLSEEEKFIQQQAIKYLTWPTEMGEVIKVMALSKGIELPLLGFGLGERRQDL